MKKQMLKEKGITLIALVVTIVVLLILAGVSINLILGQNGLISKSKEAKNRSKQGEVTDRIITMLGEWQVEKYTADGNFEAFLNGKKDANELDEVTANEDGTFDVEKDGYILTIKEDGSILNTSKSNRPQVSDIKVGTKNEDGTITAVEANRIDEGTKLYIAFETSIEGGNITSIKVGETEITATEVTLPYEVSENGTYTFYVIGTINGETSTKTVNVAVNQYKIVPKVGDYINYPVSYDNVATIGTSYIPDDKYAGKWRVLSTDGENIKIVSAGIPLAYYHDSSSSDSVENLTNGFFTTQIGTTGNTYRLCGFKEISGESVTTIDGVKTLFNNEYTAKDSSNNPMVRAMNSADFYSLTSSEMECDLVKIPCTNPTGKFATYWMWADNENHTWYIGDEGRYTISSGHCYGTRGVRPVVSLITEIQLTEGFQNADGTTNWTLPEQN